MMARWRRVVLVVVAVGTALAGVAGRQPAAAQRGPAISTTDEAHAVVALGDGAIVAAGRALNAAGDGTWAFALARYRADGALDAAFGSGGRVVTAVSPSGAEAYAVAAQADGRIVAAGRSFTRPADGAPVFALVRYLPDGRLDGRFGNGGVVTTPIGTEAGARGIAVRPDGSVIVAGSAVVDGMSQVALARYAADGALDAAFGNGGVVVTRFSGGAEGRALVVQDDGAIVVAGYAANGSSTTFLVARFTADGAPDPSFGGGAVLTAIGGNRGSEAHALVLQPDGRLVAGGFSNDGFGKRFTLVRYQPDGSLDRGFGDGGIVRTQFCSGCFNDVVQGLALPADGRIVAAGHSAQGGGFRVAVARYTTGGAPDSAFAGGTVTTPLGGRADFANAVAALSDGRVVAAGTADPAGHGDFALVAYFMDGGLDAGFGNGGIAITDFSDPRG